MYIYIYINNNNIYTAIVQSANDAELNDVVVLCT